MKKSQSDDEKARKEQEEIVKILKECYEAVRDTVAGKDISVDNVELDDMIYAIQGEQMTGVESFVAAAASAMARISGSDHAAIDDNPVMEIDGLGEVAVEVLGAGAEEVVRFAQYIQWHVARPINEEVRTVLVAHGGQPQGLGDCNDRIEAMSQDNHTAAARGEISPESSLSDNVIENAGGGGSGTDADVLDVVRDGATRAAELTQETAEHFWEGVKEVFGEELVDATVDAIVDIVPVAGFFKGTTRLVKGAGQALVGVGSLSLAAGMAAGGGIVGVAAAPFDDGQTFQNNMRAAERCAVWGTSVTGEGTCTAVKGASGIMAQVPGTHIVTVPLSVASSYASKWWARQR